MRIVHWLFVVSVLFFLTGLGFVIAGARSARAAPVENAAVKTTPVATVKQIMQGIVGPAAVVVFNSVGSTVSAAGTDEHAPHTDAEWEAVGNSAAALAEAGNLLMMDGRAVDRGEWTKMSQAMIDAAEVALKATQAKNAQGVFDTGEILYVSCDNCHRRYQRI